MFYSESILAKKGALANIWLAAHWDRKLTKAQIVSTNIQTSVDYCLKRHGYTVANRLIHAMNNYLDDILDGKMGPMALRLSGQLLLGVVRIYWRKARYLLEDCSEAMIKIKMAFRPGAVDLPGDGGVSAVASINMTSHATGFDLLDAQTDVQLDFDKLNEILGDQLSQQVSLQDITMTQPLEATIMLSQMSSGELEQMIGADDMLAGGDGLASSWEDEAIEMARQQASETSLQMDPIEMARDAVADTSLADVSMASAGFDLALEGKSADGKDTLLSPMASQGSLEVGAITNSSEDPFQAALAEDGFGGDGDLGGFGDMPLDDPMDMQMSADPQTSQDLTGGFDVTQSKEAVENAEPFLFQSPRAPVSTQNTARQTAPSSKKRKNIFDSGSLIILDAEMKQQIHDTSSIEKNTSYVNSSLAYKKAKMMDKAAKLLRADSLLSFDSLFSSTPLIIDPFSNEARSLATSRVDKNALTEAPRDENRSALPVEETEAPLDLSLAPIDDGFGDMSFGIDDLAPPLPDIPVEKTEDAVIAAEVAEEAKLGPIQEPEQLDLLGEGDEGTDGDIDPETSFSKQTGVISEFLRMTLSEENPSMTFEDLSKQRPKTRRAASALFFELLVLKGKGRLDLQQSKPYGEITVTAKESLFQH